MLNRDNDLNYMKRIAHVPIYLESYHPKMSSLRNMKDKQDEKAIGNYASIHCRRVLNIFSH